MMRATLGTLVAVLFVTCAVAAVAQSRQMKEREERALVVDIAETNKLCGSKIAANYEWGSVTSRSDFERAGTGTTRRYCDEALKSIRLICSTPSDREAVSTQIRRVKCGFLGSDGDAIASLDSGVLDFKIDLVRPSEHAVFLYLMDHLFLDGDALSVRRAKRRDEARLANAVNRTKEICAIDISVRIDWTGMPPQGIKSGDALHCEHALDVIERICRDRPGQDAIRTQVKSVVCGYAAKRSILLENGVVIFKSDFTSSDDVRIIMEYLVNKL